MGSRLSLNAPETSEEDSTIKAKTGFGSMFRRGGNLPSIAPPDILDRILTGKTCTPLSLAEFRDFLGMFPHRSAVTAFHHSILCPLTSTSTYSNKRILRRKPRRLRMVPSLPHPLLLPPRLRATTLSTPIRTLHPNSKTHRPLHSTPPRRNNCRNALILRPRRPTRTQYPLDHQEKAKRRRETNYASRRVQRSYRALCGSDAVEWFAKVFG